MRKRQFLVSALLLVLLLLACAPQAAPAPAPQVPAPTTSAPVPVAPAAMPVPVKPAWEVQWEKVLAEGRKEGRVAISTTVSGSTRGLLVQGLKDTYGIVLEAMVGRAAEVLAKVIAERRAGLYLVDIQLMGSTYPPMDAITPLDAALILPDVTDPQVIKRIWYRGELWWMDPDHYMLAAQMFPYPPLAVNTKLAKPEEIKSYYDLLDPKWKGKILMDDPTMPGNTFASFAKNILGIDWLRQLAKQEPVIMKDQRLEVDWLAQGKVPILIGPRAETFFQFKQIGAPIQSVTAKEGGWLSAGSSGLVMFNRAAHPNAAKVFINWFLSKEGQTIFSKGYQGQSVREDVPTDFLYPEAIRQPGVKYWEKERIEIISKRADDFTLFKEVFGHLVK